MLLVQSLITALLAGIFRWDSRCFGQNLLDEPIVVGMVLGLVLGDLKTGLYVGAQIQLVFLGIVSIGAATPPDKMTASVIGVFWAITAGIDAATVVALSMPIGILGQFLGILCRVINTRFNLTIDKCAAEGDTKGIDRALWTGAAIFFVLTAVPVFIGCYFGADAVQAIIDALPPVITNGLQRSSSILPAMGMCILMNYLYDSHYAPYLFLGFTLSAFLGMSTLGCTFIACVIALITYNYARGA
ncbi:MAG: PTS sugar transporter subunit IIC [Erysipelotrichaceae bacterium]|jgi:mannose/fructose/N-acetylgalactosamine-specific phosphotransferase system component IIC|nr:PTS sugar transporter subunit IIC [Erysipelotrichaceae bacterium]MBQ1303735.1 PTS sugar transporter subunit IIC [Erysipelotrichaceae bacterium]MBQ2212993.1 PTS sugar transporter subunit IIC [Erysipelotrichaceae bacterium]MBR2791171.1 PTS sugar transporter subunit IIC [Erysipelotrichaceae bacterium]